MANKNWKYLTPNQQFTTEFISRNNPVCKDVRKKNINLTKNTGRDTSSYYWETFCQFRATGVNDCHQELSSKQNERNASTSKLLFELFELFEQQDTG